MEKKNQVMEKLVSLAKRRGFVFPGSEIYGGLNGTWDLGPLGVLLADNIKGLWWRAMVQARDEVVGLDSTILHHSKVWEASGHIAGFSDPMVECKACHQRFRADNIDINKNCSNCGKKDWTPTKDFNLMFKTHLGPVENEAAVTYLRPETAQGIFINFDNVLQSSRVKLPFGIAQIGKGFRNEITTGNFLFRVREFEMMELEYFVKPGEDEEWFDYWREERLNWHIKTLGIKKENIKLVDLPKEDLAHYSKATSEVWYDWPFMGFAELEGIANRTDFDLKNHAKVAGKKLEYFDPESKERVIPYVIEPSVGVGRAMLAVLIDAYTEEKVRTAEKGEEETRLVMKFAPRVAPIKVAVLPLVKDTKLVKIAQEIYQDLKKSWFVQYDESATVGRRYRRADEIGTPFCITIDFDSLEDASVTVRDRDSMEQERVKISEIKNFLFEKLS
ncbi:MAG: glycine--tRNA ligase [bacterium]|nr:glycine--tRNA ligase [bacterium]